METKSGSILSKIEGIALAAFQEMRKPVSRCCTTPWRSSSGRSSCSFFKVLGGIFSSRLIKHHQRARTSFQRRGRHPFAGHARIGAD